MKRKNCIILLLIIIYLLWFRYLEQSIDTYYIMHIQIDDKIPFNEYFIIPYLIWFIYIPVVSIYLFYNNYEKFYSYVTLLLIGMLMSLLICQIFPNGTDFRPVINPEKNLFSAIVSHLYAFDTNTNVFPSIHVYNSIVTNQAILSSSLEKTWKYISSILTIAICLSTMFLKQHSILDVIGAIALYFVIQTYFIVKEEKNVEEKLVKN